jgi:hypothetical protein
VELLLWLELFEQLETIFACLPASIIACDQGEKILWLNAAALKRVANG